MPAKKLPRHCGKAMNRLYIRKGTEKREWISVGYYCSVCSRVFNEGEIEAGRKDWIDRVILRGVPQVGFLEHAGGSYELEPFCSSLRACLRYLGDDHEYSYIMGTSGAAFRLMWHSKELYGGNVSLNIVAKNQFEPFRRAFKAVGRECSIYGNSDYVPCDPIDEKIWSFKQIEDNETVKGRIIESLRDKGRPILAFGVVGPPEIGVVTGYDDYGHILIGWSFFQSGPGADFIKESGEATGTPPAKFGMDMINYESSGYYRQPAWVKHTPGIILIGDKRRKPRKSSLYKSSLKWGLQITRSAKVNDFYGGLRAYEAWTSDLENEKNFDTKEDRQNAMMCHSDALTQIGEGRFHAEAFLKQITQDEPKMEKDLLAAANCYREEFELTWECWKLLGPRPGTTPGHIEKLADPDIRNQIIPIILQCRKKDEEAAHHIERALQR
jgi:hypothetical protein